MSELGSLTETAKEGEVGGGVRRSVWTTENVSRRV